ncbi:complement C1q-like protein 4 [Mytilus edulis]|uniref:complement C1q-like protein 4 n=1 Tax=Mytilus edulis TaxID=6550 RepID=UPI0039F10ABE
MLTSITLVIDVITGHVSAESSCQTTDGRYEVSVTGKSINIETTPQIIAFYAYISKDLYPGAGRRLVFDVTKTNQGKGYNSHTGVFTCPQTGIYVFVWVIRMHLSEHSTELMINGSVYGSTYLYAKNSVDGSVSGTVVAHVSKGDTVYVRNNLARAGVGMIASDKDGKSTFSGWILQ